MNQEERHKLISELGEVIAGLQVPYSINSAMLGVGGQGWLKVWNRLHLAGWVDKVSIRIKLAAALLDE